MKNNFMIEEEGTRPMLPLYPSKAATTCTSYFVLKFEDHENVTIFKVEF
jgi:hypothetical protein